MSSSLPWATRPLLTSTPFVDPLGATSVPHAPVIETAGALVWRVRQGRLQVQLVHRPRYDDWSWPKGKHEDGEALSTTAVREVTEETGKPIVVGVPLPGLQYLTPEGRVKRVHYWAARRAGAETDARALAARAPVAPVNKREIDRTEWLDADEAAERLTRASDRGPLDELREAHADLRLDTRALVIVRHGRAVPRQTWHGEEQERPLTPVGHAQASALVPVLAGYGVSTVVSSRWERCATTMDPYVRAAGLRPEYSDSLGEAQHERSPARVAAAVRTCWSSRARRCCAPTVRCCRRSWTSSAALAPVGRGGAAATRPVPGAGRGSRRARRGHVEGASGRRGRTDLPARVVSRLSRRRAARPR